MQTVIEHPTFTKQAAKIWSTNELHTFIDWIAANPLAGDVISGGEGARKHDCQRDTPKSKGLI